MSEGTDNDPLAPEMPVAFDDDGRPVVVTEPAVDLPEAEPEDQRTDFEEKLAAFLAWLAGGGDVATAGRRALLLAHLAGKASFKTDAELATALNISKGRLSQLRREITGIFGSFGRCNGRRR